MQNLLEWKAGPPGWEALFKQQLGEWEGVPRPGPWLSPGLPLPGALIACLCPPGWQAGCSLPPPPPPRLAQHVVGPRKCPKVLSSYRLGRDTGGLGWAGVPVSEDEGLTVPPQGSEAGVMAVACRGHAGWKETVGAPACSVWGTGSPCAPAHAVSCNIPRGGR